MAGPNILNFASKVVFLNGSPLTLPSAASDPGTAVAGDFYYNSTSNTVRYYNGSAWEPVSGSSYTFADSLVNTSGTVTLVNDSATPGDSKYYGTNSGGTLGYYSIPTSGITQLTGDVTAGPGTGSQTASLVATSNGTLTTLSALTTASSLATVGTIGTGTWHGTAIGAIYGGTGLTSGTSGGILGFTSGTTIASSAVLTANQLIVGGGAGATPLTLAAGTDYQVLTIANSGGSNLLFPEYTQPFSYSLWVKVSSLNGSGASIFVSNQTQNSTEQGISLFLNNPNSIYFDLINNVTTPHYASIVAGGTSVADGNWHHVVATSDGTGTTAGMKIYLDGVALSTSVNSDTLGGNSVVGTGPFILGNANYGGGFVYGLDGYLDEVAVYNIALTSGDVTSIYNSGAPNNLEGLSTASNLISWWRFEAGLSPADTYLGPIYDRANGNNLIATSLSSGAIAAVSPGGISTDSLMLQGTTDYVSINYGVGGTLIPEYGAVNLAQSAAITGILLSSSFPALTGDVTTSAGSVATTLATVNSNVGSFGSSTSIPSFTVNAKGLITAASSNAVIAPAGTLSGTTLNSTVVSSSLTSLGIQAQALNMGSYQINDLAAPSISTDAATKGYVDAAISGLTWQGPAQAYSNSNVPLTGGATLTIDGYSVQNGNLVILGNQTTASQNGEYTVSGIGTAYVLTANGLPTAAGDAWLILNGTTYGDTAFVANAAVPSATFTQFSGPTTYTFNAPLSLAGNVVSITQANTSTNGYLSSTDWNTFNNKQAAGNYITALTGDVTASGPGSATATLATVNASPGTYAITSVTVNGKGLVTTASAASTTGSGNVVLSASPTLTGTITAAALTLSSTLTVAAIASTGALSIDANSGASALQIEALNVQRSTNGTNYVTETYTDATTLTDNTTAAVAAFQFAAASFAGEEIVYVIENGASPSLTRIGTIRVTCSSDGTNPSLSDMYSESSDAGVTWSAANSSGTISVSYTTTNQGSNRTMRSDVKTFRR